MRRGFFTYAWDLVDPDARRTMNRMREDYHCNAVLVSANYHHARVLRPRAEGRKTVRYTEALAAFQPQAEKYPLPSMVPAVEPKMAGINVLDRARAASQEMNLDFGLWVVGLHNSTLGEKKPDLCVQNAFGDIYSYSLCPSQPVNRDYILALAGDLCSQFSRTVWCWKRWGPWDCGTAIITNCSSPAGIAFWNCCSPFVFARPA